MASPFKSYDIRGVYPDELDEALARACAKAFAFLSAAKRIVVGMDSRSSSPSLHRAVCEGLVDMGVEATDIGLCPTPLLNYASAKENIPGIMISASHNPPQYNALKLVLSGVQLSSPGELDEIKKLVDSSNLKNQVQQTKGMVTSKSYNDEYIQEVCSEFSNLGKIKAVIDYSNGMGAMTGIEVYKRLGIATINLNEQTNLASPTHPANPSEEKNLEQLRKTVLANQADIGIFFDGDADRSFIIDDLGRTIYPDIITALLAPIEIVGRSEKRIYYDLRFSRIVREVLKECKAKGEMMRVGNPFYKKKLREEGGVMAAELSGHIMFQDHYCIDDGLYASLKVMSLIAKNGKLSSLASALMKYHASPEIIIDIADLDRAIERVSQRYKDASRLHIDGLYLYYEDWWLSLRKSNTEPIARLRIETDSREKTEQKIKEVLETVGIHKS